MFSTALLVVAALIAVASLAPLARKEMGIFIMLIGTGAVVLVAPAFTRLGDPMSFESLMPSRPHLSITLLMGGLIATVVLIVSHYRKRAQERMELDWTEQDNHTPNRGAAIRTGYDHETVVHARAPLTLEQLAQMARQAGYDTRLHPRSGELIVSQPDCPKTMNDLAASSYVQPRPTAPPETRRPSSHASRAGRQEPPAPLRNVREIRLPSAPPPTWPSKPEQLAHPRPLHQQMLPVPVPPPMARPEPDRRSERIYFELMREFGLTRGTERRQESASISSTHGRWTPVPSPPVSVQLTGV